VTWFFARRIGEAVVLVIAVTMLTFALMSATSSTVARSIVGQTASAEVVAQKASELGLDKPFAERYFVWLGGAIRGDFGASWFTNESVGSLLFAKVPVTISLVLATVLVSAVVSVVVGVTAAIRRGGWMDRILQVVALAGFAFPSFVVALLLVLVFAVQLGWFPAIGFVPLTESPQLWLSSIVLPVTALAIQVVAATSQQVRGSMLDVLESDYIRTLRSRGTSPSSLYLRHALRSAAPPALTVLGLQSIALIGGTVIIEKVFGMLGLGTAIVGASSQGDLPIVMGVVSVMVLIIIAINLLLDLAYAWLNPKVRVA
jgi:peptide/nickel transport system permease protein